MPLNGFSKTLADSIYFLHSSQYSLVIKHKQVSEIFFKLYRWGLLSAYFEQLQIIYRLGVHFFNHAIIIITVQAGTPMTVVVFRSGVGRFFVFKYHF